MRRAALLALAALSGCGLQDERPSDRADAVREEMQRAVDAGQRIDLTEIAPFEWNVVYVFPPYTPDSVREAAVRGDAGRSFGIDGRDDIQLMSFLCHDRVVENVPIRQEPPFDDLDDRRMVSDGAQWVRVPRRLARLRYEQGTFRAASRPPRDPDADC